MEPLSDAVDRRARAGEKRSMQRVASDQNRCVPVARPGEFAPLALGRLRVWPPVVLAPMAGVTNYPFRTLCRELGAGLYVSEMITARGFLMGNGLTRRLASSRPDEHPRSVQIYGSEPTDVAEMTRVLVAEGVDHVDMNFGCPVPKVTRHGGGSAIPVKPRLMARLVRAAVGAAGSVPVTVKVRMGIDDALLTYRDAGRVAEEEGAAAIGLHARTAAQLYSGEADWGAIADLVARVDIPVLGNGDVWECWDALRLPRTTGCAGVIVGRGCLGRPWLFRELAEAFAGQEPPAPPTLGEIVRIVERHARLLADFFGEPQAIAQMRKWCCWYTAGFAGGGFMRRSLGRMTTIDAMLEVLGGLDLAQPFPPAALRLHRGKDGRRQRRVALPHGYREARDDDTPPVPPLAPAQLAAFERALDAG
jgi:nifR3 family TIM-barrel protein